jgi:hypothetical protein
MACLAPFLGSVGVIALVLSVLGVVPIYVSYFGGVKIDGSLELVSIITGTLLVLFVIVASYMLWSNHRLINNAFTSKHAESKAYHEIETLKLQLAKETETREDLRRDRDRAALTLSEKFRELAQSRKSHSTYLYALQTLIHDTPDIDLAQSIFSSSWDRHRHFLHEYCTSVSSIFTAIEGRQCCASIKIAWDSSLHKFNDLRHTEYGVDPRTSPHLVAYRTIARCYTSTHDFQRPIEESDDRIIAENIIYRRLYGKLITVFPSSDIQREITQWREQLARANPAQPLRPFTFPDGDTPYKSMLALPLFVNTEVTRSEGTRIRAKSLEFFLGVLSIDSKDTVDFTALQHTKVGFQIADDIVSCCFEYFRCVKHLEYRLRLHDTGR